MIITEMAVNPKKCPFSPFSEEDEEREHQLNDRGNEDHRCMIRPR